MAPPSKPDPASPSARPRPLSAPLSRLALLFAAPIVFFCGLEFALRLGGYGKPTELFVPDEMPGFYRTNPNFTAPFIPASFGIQPLNFRLRKHKEMNTLRVFVFGESAAQGIPEPDFGFAAQLRAQLKARFAGRTIEVFNLGITAIDSHVVYRAARQAAAFEPDLFVIYMGNNEVVGPYGPGCAYLSTAPPLRLIRAGVWVRSTRTGQLLAATLGRLLPSGAKVRDWKGMETFSDDAVRGDDPRLEAVYENFSENLQDIVELAGRAGIRTVLATVVANLKDSAPFVSLHRTGLSPAETTSWKAAYDAGTLATDLGDPAGAMAGFEEALRIDPKFAETHFRLGSLAESLGESAAARERTLGALHWDALRFRPDARINEIIRRVAGRSGDSVILVDAARAMGSDPDSPGPLAGRDILFDHVHFNWTGNFEMGRMLADACSRGAFGPGAQHEGRLDAAGCAAVLGYTPDARLRMLQTVVQLTLRPPFTNQFSFSEDQARLRKEIERTSALLGAPAAKSANLETVRAALRLDPDNAPLAVRLGIMESETGNPARALALMERAEALQPRSAELSRRKAQVLVRLQRFGEAEELLLGSLDLDRDYYSAGAALADLWADTRQFDKGERFFTGALAKAPANPYLRLEFAGLLSRAGDWGGALREARRIWDADPRGRPAMAALELMVRCREHEPNPAAAEALTLEARPHQPLDYFNNQRLVRIYSARNDPAGAVASLQALEASGPFDAAEHLDLAHRLADLNRGPEMLDELARAGRVARIEGDERQVKAIDEAIGIYRRRFSDAQPH
jgi:tetratricopeptide (TPR) repeat protein